MSKANPWIIGGIVVGTIALIALVMRKKTLANTGPSYTPTAPTTPAATPPAQTNTGGITNPPSGPVGKNAYVAQPGLIVRSSPDISDGFLGFGSNDVGSVGGVSTWLGVVTATASDGDGNKNSATGKPFVWYELKINPALLLTASDKKYAREDYVNLK